MCFVYRHGDFEGRELHAVVRWSNVETEGSDQHLFVSSNNQPEEEKDERAEAPPLEAREGNQIPNEVHHLGNRAEDMAQVRALGFAVDDDNGPAPENIPAQRQRNNKNNNTIPDGRVWGWAGIDYRKQANGHETTARINGLSGIALAESTMLTMFLLFFHRKFMETVLIIETNKRSI